MKRYTITVNGKAYDVAVEEIASGMPAPPAAAAAPATTPAPAPQAAAPAVQETSHSVGEGTKVSAPMPGVVLDIKVAVGDSIKTGQPLIVLEAMKMENDIVSPCDGTISSIPVSKGTSVNASDVLITIK